MSSEIRVGDVIKVNSTDVYGVVDEITGGLVWCKKWYADEALTIHFF